MNLGAYSRTTNSMSDLEAPTICSQRRSKAETHFGFVRRRPERRLRLSIQHRHAGLRVLPLCGRSDHPSRPPQQPLPMSGVLRRIAEVSEYPDTPPMFGLNAFAIANPDRQNGDCTRYDT
jgi:hypothetical protein